MSVRGVLVCYRAQSGAYNAEWTYWDSTREARRAEVELTPCGPLCVGVHSVVSVDPAAPRRGGRPRLDGLNT